MSQPTKNPSRCFQHYVGDTNMIHYDGALGYEAFICRQCGTYFDYTEGEHPPDKWSRSFIGNTNNSPQPPALSGIADSTTQPIQP
jgi:hypothetical protein